MFTAAWFVEFGIIAVRDFQQDKRPPLPSELLATFVVFGMIGLLAPANPRAASLAGWGIVVATLLASKVNVLAPFANFMTGGSTSPLPGLGGGVPYGAPGFPNYPGGPINGAPPASGGPSDPLIDPRKGRQ